MNQVYNCHGAIGDYQKRFFGKSEKCSCGENDSVKHIVQGCKDFEKWREKFLDNYKKMELKELMEYDEVRRNITLMMSYKVKRMCE